MTASLREQRRSIQRELGRAQVLDAAEEVFARKGFHAATLKEVAERAEFSVGSVYTFFAGKEDLYLEVFGRRAGEFMPDLRAVAAEPGSAIEVLHRLADFQVAFFRAHPQFGRLLLRATGLVANLEPSLEAPMAAGYEGAMSVEAEVFARGQRDGELVAGDPAVLARLFSALVFAYMSTDPAVVGAAPQSDAGLPVDDLHALLERAFRA